MLKTTLIVAGGAYLLGKAYDKYASPEEKNNWESTIKMHHGEIGILAIILGLLLGSIIAIAIGIGLVLHDIDDISKWFKSHKFRT